MKPVLYLTYILLLFTILSCSTEPEPINFGQDQCEHCRMTIVDNKFGAELITTKGKIFKFDAVECMINYIKEGKITRDNVERYLVISTYKPGELIDAVKAAYLYSQHIPSPMGEFLSAYSTRDEAAEYLSNHHNDGTFLTWNELLNKFGVQ